MTITRCGLHDEISLLDEKIDALNKDKASCFKAYRQQMEAEKRTGGEISAEIKACKKAFKLKRALTKNRAAVEQQDALVDEILAEIEVGTRRATRATRDRASLGTGGGSTDRPTKVSRPGKGQTLSEEVSPAEIPDRASVSAPEAAPDPQPTHEGAASPIPLKQPELNRADKREGPAQSRQTNRPVVQGKSLETCTSSAALATSTEVGEGRIATDSTMRSAPLVAAVGMGGRTGAATTEFPESEPVRCEALIRRGEVDAAGDTAFHTGSPPLSSDPLTIPTFLRREPNDPVWS